MGGSVSRNLQTIEGLMIDFAQEPTVRGHFIKANEITQLFKEIFNGQDWVSEAPAVYDTFERWTNMHKDYSDLINSPDVKSDIT